MSLFTGKEIAEIIAELGFTHVIWVPDSTLGTWEAALEDSPSFRLLRVCREGEAWAMAAGLHLGGKSPLLIMQCTGLFESGDALRNAVYDLGLPLLAIIGLRNYLILDSPDSAKRFAQPILDAWDIDYHLIASENDKPQLQNFLAACLRDDKPGVVLIAEGKG